MKMVKTSFYDIKQIICKVVLLFIFNQRFSQIGTDDCGYSQFKIYDIRARY